MLFETGKQKATRIKYEHIKDMLEQDKCKAYNIIKELTDKWAVLTADSIPHHFERLIEENKQLKKRVVIVPP